MFIIILTYLKDLNEVDKYLAEHKEYLNKFYQSGNFIVSGKQKPRTGGVIISKAANKQELEKIIAQDPFSMNGVAQYQIIEFEPTGCIDELLPIFRNK